jgi:hypothetical protein
VNARKTAMIMPLRRHITASGESFRMADIVASLTGRSLHGALCNAACD